jgi:hypothetical protein
MTCSLDIYGITDQRARFIQLPKHEKNSLKCTTPCFHAYNGINSWLHESAVLLTAESDSNVQQFLCITIMTWLVKKVDEFVIRAWKY